jgi:PIN domain nuclease of toxin-antitoxin system
MILLLDAHALVWWLAGSESMSRDARSAIADPDNDVLVSAATVWELAIKRATGRIRFDGALATSIERAGFSGLAVGLADAEAAAALPDHHRDPFDRMLVAQAARLDAVIVTRDREIERYGRPVIRA